MAVQTPQRGSQAGYSSYEEERGQGWMTFAGVLLLTLGTLNAIDGIAAISKAHFYVGNAHYVFGDLKTWGWVVLCLGALQLLVGLGVFAAVALVGIQDWWHYVLSAQSDTMIAALPQ